MRALLPLFALMLALVGGTGLVALFYRAEVQQAQAEGREPPGLFGYIWSFVPMPEGGFAALTAPDPKPEAPPQPPNTPLPEALVAPPAPETVATTVAPEPAALPEPQPEHQVVVRRGTEGLGDCQTVNGRKVCGTASTGD